NGEIHLVHPENWKRGRKYNSERQWVNMIYHEMGHYILWTDAERKADVFAMSMVRGLAAERARGRWMFEPVEETSDRFGSTALRARRRPIRKRRRSAAGPRSRPSTRG